MEPINFTAVSMQIQVSFCIFHFFCAVIFVLHEGLVPDYISASFFMVLVCLIITYVPESLVLEVNFRSVHPLQLGNMIRTEAF